MLRHIVKSNIINRRFNHSHNPTHTHYINKFPLHCDNYKMRSDIEIISYDIKYLKTELNYITQLITVSTGIMIPVNVIAFFKYIF